jgi:hypothetical protein
VRLDEHLAVIRVVFDEEDEESSETRARTPAQRKGTKSQKVAGKVGGGERFDLIIVCESESGRVGQSSRSFLQAGQLGEWLCRREHSGLLGC